MAKSRKSHIELFEGIIIGASLAAAATFLFGTKKGKALRKQVVHQYKKLGRTTKQMRKKLGSAIRAQVAKRSKSKVQRMPKRASSDYRKAA